MMNRRNLSMATAAAAFALATAACGTTDSQSLSAAPASSPVNAVSPVAPSATPATKGVAGTLGVWQSPDFGPLIKDSAGFTLYRFEKDSADPPASTCDGSCATTWPPVPATGLTAGDGVDASLLGSVTRADGTRQLTLAGHPLYRFSKDTNPGQANGQGVGYTWFAAAPDGSRSGLGTDGQQLPPLSVVDNPALGAIIRDGNGHTLYRFTRDSAWPMRSDCTGACLTTWKPAQPLDRAGRNAIEGIDPELLSTFTRPDGTKQLAIDCWLLYWFTGDKSPGDTNGQGISGTWFAVSPTGRPVKG